MSRRDRVFGVVVPVPEEVSRIADRVRRHYDPNFPRIGPHVTVLPPRKMQLTRRQVREAVERATRGMRPFRIALGPIRTFRPVMPVVFASLKEGKGLLSRLHRNLALGALKGTETFPYVPHLTLGQALDAKRFPRALLLSRRLFSGISRNVWPVDRLLIVERLSEEIWIPLPPVFMNRATPAETTGRARTTRFSRRPKT